MFELVEYYLDLGIMQYVTFTDSFTRLNCFVLGCKLLINKGQVLQVFCVCNRALFCDLEALGGLFWTTVILHKLLKHCTEFCIVRMNKDRRFPTTTLCFRQLFS